MPGSPTTVTSCGVLGRDRLREDALQQRDVDLATDERRVVVPRGSATWESGLPRVEDPDRLRLALQRRRRRAPRSRTRAAVASYVASPTATPISGATDWIREAVLIASPRRNPSPEAGGDAEAHERLAGVDPHAEAERRAAHGRAARSASSMSREPGADRPLGVVLVGGRDPEDPDHGVADELLDHPAVALDLVAGDREVGVQHPVDVLGVSRLGRGREPDEVAEQRGDDLALLGDRPRARGRSGTRRSSRRS